jgi:hypothetical protein
MIRPSEPAPERPVNSETARRAGLFSHPPEAEASEQSQPLTGDGADWHEIPFSDEVTEARRTGRPRLAVPRWQPAAGM